MLAVVIKEFRQLRRDHRTVAMLVMIPLVLLLVFGYAASFDVSTLRVGLYGANAGEPWRDSCRRTAYRWSSRTRAAGRTRRRTCCGEANATVAFVSGPQPALYVDGADLFSARAAIQALGRGARPARNRRSCSTPISRRR